MSYDGRQVANFILDICDGSGRTVSNLSLQKIVYFCHAWSLATLGRPLVRHQFEAWQYGPVLPYLYRDFKSFESSGITSRAAKLSPVSGRAEVVKYDFPLEDDELIRKVVGFYSSLSPGTLVELSHVEEGPWSEVWNHGGKVNPGMKIQDGAIRDFYENALVPY